MPKAVFINCPFDRRYTVKFRALVFTAVSCGFTPRCALELDDASENRLAKIIRIVGECPLAIHDISRTQLDGTNRLPRFNMPFELGIFFGAKNFGKGQHVRKACLIVDTDRYRYQKFLSDISGQDIGAHADNYRKLINVARNWLSQHARGSIPGDQTLIRDYERFVRDLPKACCEVGLEPSELIYNDFLNFVQGWIAKRASLA